ncbi:MAG: glycine cleavage system aminomethyltransferase GcvT [Actinomycetota bacterium]
MDTDTLRSTPVAEVHRALGAKMVPFAGWEMPLEYEGTVSEHRTVRTAVGIFDLTHLGKVEVRGAGALESLQRVFSNDLSQLAVGEAQYNLCCNEQGGIVDDLIAYREEGGFLLVPNAANVEKVFERVEADLVSGVRAVERPDLAVIAVQGPHAAELLALIFPKPVASLVYMSAAPDSYRGKPVRVARTGYTGERGFEVLIPEVEAADLFEELLQRGKDLGVKPVGLGARDTLRLEMGYPLHGNDIDETTSPVEAGLMWAVALDKGEFTGSEAIAKVKQDGPSRRLRGLRMLDRGIPRHHCVAFSSEAEVGRVTSGNFSPTLGYGVAMAYLRPEIAFGDRVEVDIRGKRAAAEVVRPPFVDSRPK